MNLKRITRLLKLLQTLQSGQAQNAKRLASACGVSRRTIFRDLETLREAGVPLEYDKEQDRYLIPNSFFLPPTNFTAEEALSVIALAGELGDDSGLPFYGPARQAALKLESSLPGPLREELRSMTRSIQIDSGQINTLSGVDEFYQQLVDAIAKRRVVRITYGSLTEWETIDTKLRPYQMLFIKRSWYVIGRSSLHREVRTFNVGRIQSISMLRTKYSIPRSFSLEKHFGNAWVMIPGTGPDQEVVVRFASSVAKNVAEVVWHKTQRVTFLQDGSLEFRATVSGLDEIAWWVLGYGDLAEVLKPAKLRRIIARRVHQMYNVYRTPS